MHNFEPKDIIAALTLIGSFFLVANGDTLVAPLIITTIVGFYFGHVTGVATGTAASTPAAPGASES